MVGASFSPITVPNFCIKIQTAELCRVHEHLLRDTGPSDASEENVIDIEHSFVAENCMLAPPQPPAFIAIPPPYVPSRYFLRRCLPCIQQGSTYSSLCKFAV